MAKLLSKDIKIFPFGTTRSLDPYGRVFNEQNVSRIIKNVTDYNSYVISYDSDKKIIEFMINGYYVVANISSVLTINKPLYATIVMQDEDAYAHLSGGDDLITNEFTGVEFHTQPPSDSVYMLYLLNKSWRVPAQSKYKISAESIEIDRIYCGTSTDLI